MEDFKMRKHKKLILNISMIIFVVGGFFIALQIKLPTWLAIVASLLMGISLIAMILSCPTEK